MCVPVVDPDKNEEVCICSRLGSSCVRQLPTSMLITGQLGDVLLPCIPAPLYICSTLRYLQVPSLWSPGLP